MKLFFCAVFLFGCSAAHAQNQKSAIAYKISYQRGLPKSVSKVTPQGAKSCFFGKFRPRQNSARYAIHLFKADSRPEKSDQTYPVQQKFTLDIFRVGSNAIYRRVNHVAFNYSSFGWGYDKFGCQWFWADAHHKTPVIQFDISAESEGGNNGDSVFASFVDGLTSTPKIQSFMLGRWRASDISGEDNFVRRANDGAAVIYARIYPSYAGNPYDFKFKWQGKKFTPTVPLNGWGRNYFIGLS